MKPPNTINCKLCGTRARVSHQLSHTRVYRCLSSDCGLRFAEPQLGPSELVGAYARLYYPQPAVHGSPVLAPSPLAVIRQLFASLTKAVGSLEGLQLLDFGCGTGDLCAIATELGAHVTGVEPSDEARRIAEERLGTSVFRDLGELGVVKPDAMFDFVTMLEVVEHLRLPWVDLAQLRARMTPGAKLVISTPNAEGLRARLQGHLWPNFQNPTHFYYFTGTSLRTALSRAGFSSVNELSLRIRYPKHGFLRRRFNRFLQTVGLHGGITVIATNAEPRRADAGLSHG